MSATPTPEGKKPGAKSRTYFLVAVILLIMMSILWGLDSSFVYITLGAAVFFIFLALWNRPRIPQRVGHSPTASSKRKSPDFFDAGKEIGAQKKVQPAAPFQSNEKKVTMIAYFFIFFVFTLIFSAVVFLDTSYSEEAIAYFNTAEQFRYSGEYDSAERYYELAIAEEPEYPEALTAYANGLIANQKYEPAMQQVDRALAINSDDEEARYTKALVYYYQQKYKPSLQELFALMDKNPSYYEAMVLAGDDYYMQNKYDSAIYWYEQGYGNGVRNAGLCHVMAYIYDEKGKQEKAVPLYQEALSYDSTRIEIYERLSQLFPGRDGEEYRKAFNRYKALGY